MRTIQRFGKAEPLTPLINDPDPTSFAYKISEKFYKLYSTRLGSAYLEGFLGVCAFALFYPFGVRSETRETKPEEQPL
jgi:hypothetical protein